MSKQSSSGVSSHDAAGEQKKPERTAPERMFRFGKNKPTTFPPAEQRPRHIAFIMDGNGRWAKRRGLSRSVGHAEGSRMLKEVVKSCYNLGIRYVSVYAFSSENWARPQDEIDQLMKLLLEYLKNALIDLEDRKVRIRIIGSRQALPEEVLQEIQRVEAATAGFNEMDFLIAVNYGGRQEILQAVRFLAHEVSAGRMDPDAIDENCLKAHLDTADIPDPDLLIRTSGEQRLSNFMLWQCAYTEMLFPDVLWPDFKERHLKEALQAYAGRERRYGGI